MGIFDRIKEKIWGKHEEAKPPASATPTPTVKPATPISASAGPSGGSTSSTQPQVAQASPAPQSSVPTPAPTAPPTGGAAKPAPAPTATAGASTASVDVEAIMDAAVKANGQKLDWRHSIVDTMKALGMESSLSERKELADELGYTGDQSDSAAMNIWLQKALMNKLAENGGKVPANLMD